MKTKIRIPGTAMLLAYLIAIFAACTKDTTQQQPPFPLPPSPLSLPAPKSIIVYTDVNPNITITAIGGTYYLDLNKDGNNDFSLQKISGTNEFYGGKFQYKTISLTPLNNNYRSDADAHKMHIGDSIGSTNGWADNIILRTARRSSPPGGPWNDWEYLGDWSESSDGYAGLRIIIDGQIYYGWVRLSVNFFKGFTIKDYAYNSTPNLPIKAGQKK